MRMIERGGKISEEEEEEINERRGKKKADELQKRQKIEEVTEKLKGRKNL